MKWTYSSFLLSKNPKKVLLFFFNICYSSPMFVYNFQNSNWDWPSTAQGPTTTETLSYFYFFESSHCLHQNSRQFSKSYCNFLRWFSVTPWTFCKCNFLILDLILMTDVGSRPFERGLKNIFVMFQTLKGIDLIDNCTTKWK